MIDRITARRASLAAQMDAAKAQYAQLEAQLHALGRNLDAMQGGLQELDALITAAEDADQSAASSSGDSARVA